MGNACTNFRWCIPEFHHLNRCHSSGSVHPAERNKGPFYRTRANNQNNQTKQPKIETPLFFQTKSTKKDTSDPFCLSPASSTERFSVASQRCASSCTTASPASCRVRRSLRVPCLHWFKTKPKGPHIPRKETKGPAPEPWTL